MNPKIKKVLKFISNGLLALVVLLALLLHGVKLIGLTPYSVLSGSMQSVYPTGSLIYVKDVDPTTLEVDDIITFRLEGGTVATHRIIELIPDEADSEIVRFRTKGDENEVADGTLVSYDRVIGQPVLGIPCLGYLAVYIMQPPGQIVAITAAVALVLVEVIIGVLLDEKKEGKQKEETE